MDHLFKKKRSTNRASQASVLSIDTGSILDDTSVQFERLPTSHSPRPPPVAYSSSSTYAQSSSERLSRALGNFSPPAPPSPTNATATAGPSAFTGHASISPPVNLIAHVVPPDDPTDDRDRDRERERESRGDARRSRPGSPSERSIRSVASGEQRRRRTESSAASEHSFATDDGRRSVASQRSANGEQSEARKPLPLSPQKKYANGRTNSAGEASSSNASMSTSASRHPPSLMSASSYSSPYAPSLPSSRSDNRSQYTASIASSSNGLQNPRRGSVASTVNRSGGASVYGDGPVPALPTPSPYSSDFDFARPSSPTTINQLFEELIPTLASTPKAFDDMRALDPDKKWIMLHNAAFSKWKAAREKLTHRAVEARSAPAVGQSVAERGHHDFSQRAAERTPNKARAKNESPEWYVARFMDGTITAANVASLSVCLRTYELA